MQVYWYKSMMKIKLFCFPYAGGSAAAFARWKKHLHSNIEMIPVELAGRGKRSDEKFYKDIPEAIDDVLGLIRDEIIRYPYALFGHSMGALIAYELAQRIRTCDLPPPAHYFISGSGAPHVTKKDNKVYHLMDEGNFKRELMQLGGTPPDFFDSPDLVNAFLPLLRNDFRLTESLNHDRDIIPLDNDISVLLGKDDDLTPEECDGWKEHSSRLCTIYHFEGGHFYLNGKEEQIAKIINSTLKTFET
jgi:surfactin synthase thioesterase subunit